MAASLHRCGRAAPRPHVALVDAQRGRACAAVRPRRGAARAAALRHSAVLAEAGAVAGGAARRLLACHLRHSADPLAAAAGHVYAADTPTVVRRWLPLSHNGLARARSRPLALSPVVVDRERCFRRSIETVGHVAEFDEHAGSRREVQASQVIALALALVPPHTSRVAAARWSGACR